MAVFYRCDRCKWETTSNHNLVTVTFEDDRKFDLCSTCFSGVEKYIRNYPEVITPPSTEDIPF